MTTDQIKYLQGLLKADDASLFIAFAKMPRFRDLVEDFERGMMVAWQEFLQFNKRTTRAAQANPAYQKMEFAQLNAGPRRPHTPAGPLPTASTKIAQAIQGSTPQVAPSPAPKPTPVAVPVRSAAASTINPLPPTAAAFPPVPMTNNGSPAAPAQAAPANPLPTSIPLATALGTSATPSHSDGPAPQVPPPRLAPRPPLRFSTKNARQGEPFEGDIAIEPATAKPRMIRIVFPEGMGLVADATNWRITGTPNLSGELTLSVEYNFSDDSPEAVRTGTLPLIVNPDPKTLWKDIASDRNTPFWKEDSANSVATGTDARILAARRRGRSHAHKGTCCDDDYFIEIDPANGWYLAVVADGAGSAKFSRRGSQIVTQTVATFMRNAFGTADGQALLAAASDYATCQQPGVPPDEKSKEGQTVRNALYVTLGHAAYKAVRALHDELAARPDIISNIKELSTTLLIGLARKVGSRWFCAAYWVGDGAVGVYRKNREVILMGDPDSGEFSGQTRFLSADEVSQDSLLRRLRFTVVDDMTGFILMTDGVSDPRFPSEMQLGRLTEWDALWQEIDAEVHLQEPAQADARLLEWLNFWATGEYDDRTIAIIY